MKFLHTADWHIGIKAAHLGGAGPWARAQRLRSARRVIDAANARGVDFVLVAGDTFDDNSVSPDAAAETAAILETSAAPVYVIPGNHDYLCPGSLWERPEFAGSGKIRLLADAEPVDIGPAVLYPCPIRERRGTADPTAWIPAAESPGGKPRVALAHGSVEGLPQDAPDFPIPRGLADEKGLDYAALGHWHSFARYESGGACRMAYCGTHEATRFGRPGSGFADVVTINGRGAAPEIEQIAAAGLTWVDMEETVACGGDIRAVAESILGIGSGESTLVRVALSGVCAVDDVDALSELRAVGDSGRFLHFELDDAGLSLLHGGAGTGWIAGIGEPLVRKTAERLAAAAAKTAALDRALLELCLLAKGASR